MRYQLAPVIMVTGFGAKLGADVHSLELLLTDRLLEFPHHHRDQLLLPFMDQRIAQDTDIDDSFDQGSHERRKANDLAAIPGKTGSCQDRLK
jgi:hypothetical protein